MAKKFKPGVLEAVLGPGNDETNNISKEPANKQPSSQKRFKLSALESVFDTNYLDMLSATGKMDTENKAAYDEKRKKAGEDPTLNYTAKAAEKLAQQKQKEMDSYKASDEYKKTAPKIQTSGTGDFAADAGAYIGSVISNLFQTGDWKGDTKAGQIQAEGDYLQQIADNAKNQGIILEDMAYYEKWPEEDKKDLERYLKYTGNGITGGGLITVFTGAEAGRKRLEDKYGKETVRNVIESLSRKLNAENAAAVEKEGQKNASLLESLLSVPVSVAGAVTGTSDYLTSVLRDVTGVSSGRFTNVDPNTPGALPGIYAEAVRQKETENVKDWAQATAEIHGADEKTQEVMGQVASTVYTAGIGALDNVTRVAMTGGIGSLALAAMGSFSSAVREATLNGASAGQAAAIGLVKAASEVLTEKLPLDNLLGNLAKAGSGSGFVSILKEATKQAGIELTTEELNLVAGIAAEALILQESSDYRKKISEMVARGMSYEEAAKAANADLVAQAGQTALQSGLSGFMTSAGTSVATQTGGTDRFTNVAQEYGTQKETAQGAAQSLADMLKVDRKPQAEQQGGQKGQAYIDSLIDETAAQLNGAPADPVDAAVKGFETTGTVTNKQATDILNSVNAVQQIVQETGVKLDGLTMAQRRNAVKTAVEQIAKKLNIDNAATGKYNNNITGGERNDRTGSLGTDQAGVSGIYEGRGADDEGRRTSEGASIGSGLVLLSPKARNLLSQRGVVNVELRDSSADNAAFSAALDNARAADDANGWAVTPKTREDLDSGNIRTYMDVNSTTGFAIAPDGDIEAVFANKKAGAPKGSTRSTIPTAIANGGTKLDCYGEGLVRLYAKYGFVPVAKTTFNAEYANPGWTQDKGTPDIYFMMHNGDNADSVVENYANYPIPTKAELDALPVMDYDEAYAYRDGLLKKQKPGTVNTENGAVGAAEMETEDGGSYSENTVGGAQSRFKHQQNKSSVYENTYANATGEAVRGIGNDAQNADPNVSNYDYVSEKESVYNAMLRTNSPENVEFEYEYLLGKDGWTGEDNDTAFRVLAYLRKNGDLKRLAALAKKQREVGTTGGQLTQSFAKYTRTPSYAADSAIVALNEMTEKDVPANFYKGKTFEVWKSEVAETIENVANQVDSVAEGNTEAIKEIIRSLAKFRKTTAWFGLKSNLTKIAEDALKEVDFQTAKDIVAAQISQIPNDFTKRSVGQVVKTIRIHNMLSALTTINRNVIGNASMLMDATVDSTVGRALDALVSKTTNKRTVGDDVKHAKTYFDSAWKAAKMAALSTELDIPSESESRFSTGNVRTYSPQGGPIMRFLSAYEKAMKYALEVSDSYFEGGSNAAVDKSLRELGETANLSEKEIRDVSEMVGKRRTFKDDRAIAKASKGLKKALNEFGTKNMGLGDIAMPFAGTGSNVAQAAIDYTSGGLNGFASMLKLMIDAHNGKPVDAVQQRRAVTNAARGLSGIGLTSIFTALAACGVLGVHEDEDYDKRALEQSLDLSGAQLNVSAALRGLSGESTKWQKGDVAISVDFLEPFNAQMYLGYLLSQEETIADMAKAYPQSAFRSVWQSVLDMPMMQTLSDLSNAANSDDPVDAAGQIIGNTATGFVPSWVRQTAQYFDPYYRDTTGSNTFEKSGNQVLAALPGLSTVLPKKYSGLGEEQLRYESKGAGLFNTFVNPGDMEKIGSNEIVDYLGELYERTGKASIYPERQAPKSITVDGKKILITGADMTEAYQKTYGESNAQMFGALIESADFQGFTDEMKVAALEKAKAYSAEFAKAAVSDYKAPEKSKADLAAGIITSAVKSKIDSAIKDDSAQAINTAYDIYSNLKAATKNEIKKDASGRVKYFITAKENGVKTETFLNLYKTFDALYDNDSLKASEKAAKWSYELEKAREAGTITETQKSALKEEMNFWQMIPAATGKFDAMTGSGMSADTAQDISWILNGLEPQTGKNEVSWTQKAEAISGTNVSAADKIAALKAYGSNAQDENLDQMIKKGYSPDEYVAALMIYTQQKEQGGKGTKERTIDQLRRKFKISYNAAEAIYNIYG